MSDNDKLDLILAKLIAIQSRIETIEERNEERYEEVKEAISDLGLPGSGFSISRFEDED